MEKAGLKRINDPSRKGDFAEYYAVTWLWDNGYEVFKNSGRTGMIDLIAIKDGEITLIDVKTSKVVYNKYYTMDTLVKELKNKKKQG